MVFNYFLYDFAKKEYNKRSNYFLFILWAALRNYVNKKGKITQDIKKELRKKDIEQEDFYQKVSDIIKSENNALYEESVKSIPKIDSVQVKNFKGFGSLSDNDQGTFIDFIKDKNIFFSPNGGGKTSLCNALEYKVTGNIKEAERRGLKVSEYIKRNNSRSSVEIAFKDNDDTFNISHLTDKQQQMLNHAFIEHNRINAFALLGSRDSKDSHEDIISYAIGLEDLDEFISYFIKPESFKLNDLFINSIQTTLHDIRQTIENKNQKLQTNNDFIESQKNELKDSLELKNETELKKDQVEEAIQELYEKIEQIDKDLIAWRNNPNLSSIDFLKSVQMVNIIKNDLKKFEEMGNVVEENISEVNLTDLFKAVDRLDREKYVSCPVCETNISETKKNPFDNAKETLKEFEDIQQTITEKQKIEERLLNQHVHYANEIIRAYNHNAKNFNELNLEIFSDKLNKLDLNSSDKEKRLLNLKYFITYIEESIADFIKYRSNYKMISDEIANREKIINESQEKRSSLTEKKESLKNKLGNWKNYDKNNEDIKRDIEKIKEENKVDDLEQQLQQEENFNNFIKGIEDTYKSFHQTLINYRNKIQESRFTGTEESILDYYSKMNKNDTDHETITDLSFKLKKDKYEIEIEVDGEKANAFTKLSEGHLRTLGLSIILAIAKKEEFPFLIFDDIVNAIDTEHRSNIIDLMYEDNYLNQTQLIITTHDRLFWERFCNAYPSTGIEKVYNISHILEYTNAGIIIKQYNVDFASRIRDALDKYDVRQALIYCRIWFETMAIEYCRNKGIKLEGRVKKQEIHTVMNPVLEDAYNAIDEDKDYGELTCFKKLKKDFINWQGQNQEHHAFNESNYNFVHATTSNEVEEIFDAVFELSLRLFEQNRTGLKKEFNRKKENLEKLEGRLNNSDFQEKAPKDVRSKTECRKDNLEKEIKDTQKFIDIIEEIEDEGNQEAEVSELSYS